MVILLDAPAQVLHDRKGEGSVESLEQMRQDYLALEPIVERFVRVDATQDPEAVTRDVVEAITGLLENKAASTPAFRTGGA
jgi:thymidylate kinase